jgi:hypothetical protein
LATAATLRDTVAGSGNVTITSGSNLLDFVNAQSFRPGTTIVVDSAGTPYHFTIMFGSDKKWHARQVATASPGAKAFRQTDTAGTRTRGTTGYIIPDAPHYSYVSIVDGQGSPVPDGYTYLDTIEPVNGLHPYNRDRFSGQVAIGARGVQEFVPDLNTRVKQLEGYLRYCGGATGGDGDITLAGGAKRLVNMETRLNAIEAKLNGGATPSTISLTAASSKQTILDLGDM